MRERAHDGSSREHHPLVVGVGDNCGCIWFAPPACSDPDTDPALTPVQFWWAPDNPGIWRFGKLPGPPWKWSCPEREVSVLWVVSQPTISFSSFSFGRWAIAIPLALLQWGLPPSEAYYPYYTKQAPADRKGKYHSHSSFTGPCHSVFFVFQQTGSFYFCLFLSWMFRIMLLVVSVSF